MTKDQTISFIEWFKQIILAFENFFHQVQLWFDTDIKTADWFINLTSGTDAAAEEEAE